MKRKILAIILSMIVAVAYIPVFAFADTDGGAATQESLPQATDSQTQTDSSSVNTQNTSVEPDGGKSSDKTFEVEAKDTKGVSDSNNNQTYTYNNYDNYYENNYYEQENSEDNDKPEKDKKASLNLDLRVDLSKYIVAYNSQNEKYDGTVKKKAIQVKKYSFSTPLSEGIDYVINGVTEADMPGTYEFTVKGIGKYKGEITKSWKIDEVSIDDCTIKLADRTYNGKPQSPEIESAVITETGKNINKEYFGVVSVGKDAGYYTASVTGNEMVKGTKDGFVWKINKENISNCEITTKDVKYDGTEKTPVVSVKIGSQTLGTADYDIIYGDKKIDSGDYEISIKGKKNLEGVKNISWKISPLELTENDVYIEKRSVPYNGQEHKQSVSVIVDGRTLTDNDYEVTGDTGLEKKEYILTVTGKNNYIGTVKKSWNITDLCININRTSFNYNESVYTPEFSVTAGDEELDETSYTVSEESVLSASEAGNYSIIAEGNGKYEGAYAAVDWEIKPVELKNSNFKLNKDTFIYDGEEKSVAVMSVPAVNTFGKTLKAGTDYEISSDSTLSASLPDTYKVIVKGKGNYSGTAELSWKINGYSIKACVVEIDKDTFVYNGKEQGPTVKVGKAFGNEELKEGTDYTISGTKSATDAGTYKLQVVGAEKEGFYGTTEVYWQIKKKEVAVNWEFGKGTNSNELVYNGKEYKVSATLDGVEEVDKDSVELEIKVSGNSVDAGSYDAKVVGFESGGENYNITQNREVSYIIDPEQVVPEWDGQTKFNQDGLGHTTEAKVQAKSGEKFNPVYLFSKKKEKGGYDYSGQKPSEVGDYTVSVTGLTDKKGNEPENYQVTTDTSAKTRSFSIVKSVSGIDEKDDTRYAKEQTEEPVDDVIFEKSMNTKSSKAAKSLTAKRDSGVDGVIVQKNEKAQKNANDKIDTVNTDTTGYTDLDDKLAIAAEKNATKFKESTALNQSIEVFDNSDTPTKNNENALQMSTIWIILSGLAAIILIAIIIRGAAAKRKTR